MRKLIALLVVLSLSLVACNLSVEDKPYSIEIHLYPNIDTIYVGETYHDQGAYAYFIHGDKRIKPLEVKQVENTLNTNEIGVYKIVYQVEYEDYAAQYTRTINVVEESEPLEVTLNAGVDTIYLNSDYNDPGITVNKEHVNITVENTIDTTEPGTYTVTYTVTDSDDNVSIVTRYVHVRP